MPSDFFDSNRGKLMQPTPRGIEHAFFEAMANGYAQSVKKDAIDSLPCSKVVTFGCGDYRVVDLYFTTSHSDKSFGHTIIWHNDVPVWAMQYGGRYAKIAVPFLKECLHRAYVRERHFYGGRGPYLVRGDRFTYINRVECEPFANFKGEEQIFDLDERLLGHHWYRGMSLLKRD